MIAVGCAGSRLCGVMMLCLRPSANQISLHILIYHLTKIRWRRATMTCGRWSGARIAGTTLQTGERCPTMYKHDDDETASSGCGATHPPTQRTYARACTHALAHSQRTRQGEGAAAALGTADHYGRVAAACQPGVLWVGNARRQYVCGTWAVGLLSLPCHASAPRSASLVRPSSNPRNARTHVRPARVHKAGGVCTCAHPHDGRRFGRRHPGGAVPATDNAASFGVQQHRPGAGHRAGRAGVHSTRWVKGTAVSCRWVEGTVCQVCVSNHAKWRLGVSTLPFTPQPPLTLTALPTPTRNTNSA